ncbi:MAG: epoxyqueuosine reductase QueH [Syntrophomonadaceae bacterium]|nr:epoxyqueuosine reductase QueH [Syntrophomonadaceae bacterium]
MPKILLHICCGPCASYPVPALRDEGFELMGYYYNPNIHPYTEWQKRRDSLQDYAAAVDLQVLFDEDYDPAQYFQTVSFREARRCFYCYQLRLEKAAQIARKGKFDYFTTTLLVSKYQRHDWIRELGESIGEKYEIPFLYRDFRDGFRQTGINAREMGLYRQQYCGCLFSETERYRSKAK